ncbi:MAG: adenine-specific methyltransferase EcoRI family protein [Planctomycetaceae bacterium]|nr:adenine-specific methyltransferase EcoRI family protein [Planctomycetaceae bacterium]
MAKNKSEQEKIIKKTTPTLEERGVTRQTLLHRAQRADNDEFFTRYEDVEKELDMYPKSVWKNKVVFCNCDDAVGNNERTTSAFALYFLKKFKELGIKKLICTHYGGKVDLFNQGPKGYIFTKNGFSEIGTKEYPKNYTGSFDDPLSLKILREDTDIVCTNPPFSRAIDYWRMIIESGKKFLIISNITNPITLAFIPYFKEGKAWAGYNRVDWYLTSKRELTRAAGTWYTNIPIKNRQKYNHLKIIPLKDIPEKYKRYDDSKTLIVDNCYIPSDYKKPFAVSARSILNGLLEKGYALIDDKVYHPCINGKKCFARVLVRKTSS